MTNDLTKFIDSALAESIRTRGKSKLAETMVQHFGIQEKSADMVIFDSIISRPSKFAPVAPARFYTAMREAGYIPQQVLLLAHDVVEDPEGYEEFKREEWANTTIFMDNSLVELKNAVDANMVHEAADATAADIVILPDVMGDGIASMQATEEAWEHWYWRFRGYQKLIVIHGESLPIWLACAEELANLEPDWVSIPRICEDILGPEGIHREDLVPFAKAIFPDTPIHLLGFSNSPWWDLRAAAMHEVKSIDSAVPLRQSNTNIFSNDPGPRGSWWNTAIWDECMIDRCKNTDRIINALR